MFGHTPSYDLSNTMFSPEGRLFQVEYARNTVKLSATSLAIKYSKGILLARKRKKKRHLSVNNSTKKLFKISDNIIASSAGLSADGRVLMDYCRRVAIAEMVRYGEQITVEALVKRLGNVLGSYTQHGGVRPFGVTFQIGGIDRNGITLYETDIGGGLTSYRASAMGKSSKKAKLLLEKTYSTFNNWKDALKLLIEIFENIEEKDNVEKHIFEIMLIDEDKGLRSYVREDVKTLLK